jgi:hypothetical protein
MKKTCRNAAGQAADSVLIHVLPDPAKPGRATSALESAAFPFTGQSLFAAQTGFVILSPAATRQAKTSSGTGSPCCHAQQHQKPMCTPPNR